jgi:hypothetical protein
MPGVVETTYTFVANQVITSTLMNNIIDETTFTSTALANGTLALTAGQMKVATGGITSNELAADAVTSNAIAADAVTTAKILDGNVTTAKILDGNVTTAKILDDNVTTAKIADAAITAPKLNGAQTGTAPIFGVRAWVNFNGTVVTNVGGEDRCTIRSSGNVSKVVRSATGTFVIHFSTALLNGNYAVFGITNETVLGNRSNGLNIRGTDNSLMTTTSITIDVGSASSGGAGNNSVITLSIIG